MNNSLRLMLLNKLNPAEAYEIACDHTLTVNQLIGALLGTKENYSGHTPVVFYLLDCFFPIRKIATKKTKILNLESKQTYWKFSIVLACDDFPGKTRQSPNWRFPEEWGEIGGRIVLGEEEDE